MREWIKSLESWIFDDDSVFLSVVKFMAVILLITSPIFFIGAYLDYKEPHIILDKSDWTCTRSHTIMVPVIVGKAFIEEPEDVCDRYESR